MADVKFSQFDDAVTVIGDEQIAGLQGGVNIKFTPAMLRTILGFPKQYKALLTQSGSGNVTAVVLGNNTVGAITFSRTSAGLYSILGTGLFTVGKTFAFPKWSSITQTTDTASIQLSLANVDNLSLTTYLNGTAADGILTDFPIEITVYP